MDGRFVCDHVQTKRTAFTVELTPEEAEELSGDIMRAVREALLEHRERVCAEVGE